MKIPSLILRQLYTFGSLENRDAGLAFRLKNRLSDATLVGLERIEIDGRAVPLERIRLDLGEEGRIDAGQLGQGRQVDFPLRRVVELLVAGEALEEGKHRISIAFESRPFGRLSFSVEDSISAEKPDLVQVPYDKDDDYTAEMVERRREFVERFGRSRLKHVARFSLDPASTRGNVENFTGAVQVPLGFAGPLRVNGEHARGEFLVPLATTEGTLVASYNRGIKVVNLSGGASCTVQDDCMQRAPVFAFATAREARDFRDWVDEHLEDIRDAAEATSSVARLLFIDTYLSNRFAFLRFNYSTGDAAGQNMVGRATFAACSWILERVDHVSSFYLESNLATDKKASQVNVMRTRGKRVTAEVTVPREVLVQQMRVEPESLVRHHGIGNVGAFLSGANNNGAHSPNAITALFIATGQDVANVAESSAGILYAEIDRQGDLYISLTIPSLIVATYGGGTGLVTQRECLEAMGCAGKGKVRKFAEIVAGVALAGEISLGAAISSLDWVSSHEKYGRNR
jgi:hydroxymethylglutaryl-CoA reductase (NADPH)